MAGIKEVAKESAVSIATVSHVINQTRYVSPQLTKKVNKAIVALDYQRNVVAKNLRQKRTHMVGLVVPNNYSPFFSE